MEDEGSYGNDDIRCFILSNLATARMANAHCVVCQVRHHFDFTDEQWSSMKSDASYRFSVFFSAFAGRHGHFRPVPADRRHLLPLAQAVHQ